MYNSEDLSVPIYRQQISTEEKNYNSLEKPGIRARGSATPDPFGTAEKAYLLSDKELSPEEL